MTSRLATYVRSTKITPATSNSVIKQAKHTNYEISSARMKVFPADKTNSAFNMASTRWDNLVLELWTLQPAVSSYNQNKTSKI